MNNRIKDFFDKGRRLTEFSTRHWKLEGKRAVRCSLLEWAAMFERPKERVVRQDKVNNDIMVSTVFLGLDHNFASVGPPLLFETLVFNGPKADTMRRYATWEQAEAGHREVLQEVLSMQ